MKRILLIALIFCSFTVNAQNKPQVDSVFYLLDTTKTLPSDILWHTYKEGLVKFYELEIYAPCSELMNKPTFVYSSHSQQLVTISRNQFKSMKIASLSKLIYKLKQFAQEDGAIKQDIKKPFYLYIIEPKSSGFTMIKTQLDGSGPKSKVN